MRVCVCVQWWLRTSLIDLPQLTVLVVGTALCLATISFTLMIIALSPMVFVAVGSLLHAFKFSRKQNAIDHSRQRLNERYAACTCVHARSACLDRWLTDCCHARLLNNHFNLVSIQGFAEEGFEYNRVAKASRTYRNTVHSAVRLASAFPPVVRLLVMTGFAGLMLVGVRWMLADAGSGLGAGDAAALASISVGEFVFALVVMNQVLWPLANVGTIARLQVKALSSVSRVCLFLVYRKDHAQLRHDSDLHAIDVDPSNIRGEVEFDNVSFTYPSSSSLSLAVVPPAIDRLSFHLSAGRSVGILGTEGSGKSTLIKLLLRIFDPSDGMVRIDGYDMRAWSSGSVRRAIALMPEHNFLFEGSIADNIVYGSASAQVDDARLDEAARRAGAHGFIARLPNRYDSLLREGGINLTLGQRRRIVLARALYKKAPILLLDNPTANVDAATLRAILSNLPAIVATHNRTTIVLSDNPLVLRKLDRLLVLHHGRIVEEGTHESLLCTPNTLYAKRWRNHLGEL